MLRERIESQAYAHYNKDALLAEQKAAAQKAAKAKKALEELIAEEEQEEAQAAASKARQQQMTAKQQQSKQLQGSSTKRDALPGHRGKDSEAVQQHAATSVIGITSNACVNGANSSEAQQAARPWEAVLTPYKVPEEHVEALFQCPLTKALLIDPEEVTVTELP
ncbi:hypothetical protein WJX79_002258 [Trebouxia sp. C0005]